MHRRCSRFIAWLLALLSALAVPVTTDAVTTRVAKTASWGPDQPASGRSGEEHPAGQAPIGCFVPCAYESAPGRATWLSRDPIGEDGGLNLYGYVENNPINLWDALGDSPNGMAGRSFIRAHAKNPKQCEALTKEFDKYWDEGHSYGYLGPAALVGALAAPEAAAAAGRNVKIDGPKPNKDGMTGRICQLRWGNTPLLRLDYHPIPGSGGQPRLHLNIGPWHVPIPIDNWPPLQW